MVDELSSGEKLENRAGVVLLLYLTDAYALGHLVVYDSDDGAYEAITSNHAYELCSMGVKVKGIRVKGETCWLTEHDKFGGKTGLSWLLKNNFALRFQDGVLEACTVLLNTGRNHKISLKGLCTACGETAFSSLGRSCWSGHLTVAFDDSIEISASAIKDIFYGGHVTCDVRAMRDSNKLALFYKEFLQYNRGGVPVQGEVLDNEPRKSKYIMMLSKGA